MNVSNRFLWLLLAAALPLALVACDSSDPPVEDDEGPIVNPYGNTEYDTTGTEIRVTDGGDGVAKPGTVTWSNDFTYVLTNKAFVNSGQTLVIEEGTVIKGEPGLRENATALVVARGGRITARGTAAAPIIMTALADNVTDTTDEPGTGSWGGLIVLGRARTNTTPGTLAIEGIPTTESRGLYGCGDTGNVCDDNDNSGTIQYVSIRYGGAEIGEGNEINGLTFGGVGAGTTVDHVEVFRNFDDGIEFFGGTVNTKYMAVAFAGDDGFDTDQGYRGKNQFWFGIQGGTAGDNGAEMDGGDAALGGEQSTPLSQAVIWNATYIGGGTATSERAVRIRENAAPSYYRSLFTGFEKGIEVQDVASVGGDSRERLEAGDFSLRDLIFGTSLVGDTPELIVPQSFLRDYLATRNARYVGTTSVVVSISREANGGLNPRATGPALLSLGTAPTDAFFTNAAYVGAFGPNAGDNWLQGWTALDQLGYLTD